MKNQYIRKFLRAFIISLTFTIISIPFVYKLPDFLGIIFNEFLSLFGAFCLGVIDEMVFPIEESKGEL